MQNTPGILVLMALLTGCFPGKLETPDGTQRLRTALHFTETSEEDASTSWLDVLLSTAHFKCEPLTTSVSLTDEFDTSDAETIAAQRAEDGYLQVAPLFTEGSHTVLLRLSRPTEGTWAATFPTMVWDGVPETSIWSQALSIEVREVEVTNDGFYDDETAQVDVVSPLAGEVVIGRDESELDGEFDFPDIQLSGEYVSEPCDEAALPIFTLLEEYFPEIVY